MVSLPRVDSPDPSWIFPTLSSSSTGNRSTRTRTLTSTHDAFSLPTHSPNTSQRERMDSPGPQFSYPPASAYSPSTSGFDYMPQSTRDNFRRSTLSSPGLSPSQTSLQNTWGRIRKFMAREYPELGDSLNYGLAPAIIDQVEAELGMTLPPAVRESYLLCDGQEAESGTACAEGLFFGLTLLPLEEALDEWRFWREVDEDPTTGANPQLLQVMASIPTGWIRWQLPGVDLAPAEQGTYGQVIVFGRDFDTKVVMFRGEGEDGWATWLQNFIEELEAGEGFEVGATDSASEGSDDVGYESYFYDGSGRSKGVGGTRDGAAGMKLTGEYKGWNVLEAFADKSYLGTGSGVEVPIPIMVTQRSEYATKSRLAPMPPIARNPDHQVWANSTNHPPTIQVTRASMAQPLLLPTQSDIIPDTSERDDLESGECA
ncbi:SMI1 / KNR4 family [Rhizoctonia solani]|uniref:SMI1 / KNR4 family n=1 Tax=Rhizoctonia solani TaxID=456999 RepID=A0A8H7II58_9AGAM|nr:SMI1 / KNR4 family [Rhizoctonia solani]